MVQSLVLDLLLFVILFLLVPIGFFRGGLREVCSAAGLLLGLHIANEWAARWGTRIAAFVDVRESVCQFIVAVATLTLVTAIVGYGAGAAFSYRPGPGGRMYGGLISLLIGAVFLGSVMNFVSRFLSGGNYPDVIEDGYLTRVLSIGLDWVLLAVGLAVVVATLFGMIVRERDSDAYEIPVAYQAPADVPSVSAPRPSVNRDHPPDKIEPPEAAPLPLDRSTAAVKIKEVRHWEEPPPPKSNDLTSGWQRTWPASSKGSSLRARSTSRATRPQVDSNTDQQTTGTHDARIIREWLDADRNQLGKESGNRPNEADE